MPAEQRSKTYVGILNDEYGGMTPTGAIIKDAWIFGLIPESETCEGWNADRLQLLYEKTSALWGEYGYLAANLPEDMRARHARIHDEAIERARRHGWQPDAMVDQEEN